MYTMPQLKAAAAQIVEQYKTTEEEARHIIGQYNRTNNAALADVVAGDLSSVPQVAQQIGVIIQGKSEKAPSRKTKEIGAQGSTKKISNQKKITAPQPAEIAQPAELETVQGEIIEDSPELPAGTAENIEEWLLEFSQKYDLDLVKCSGMQWRSACIYIGQRLKASGILIDRAKQRIKGGTPYKPERMEKLLYIWEYLTGLYRHVPLATDYIAFTGTSREWFYNSQGKVTSGLLDIAKKAREIEEAALSASITDHRENPTGRIYYTKARLGWRESVEVIHTTSASVGTLDDIPKLTDING